MPSSLNSSTTNTGANAKDRQIIQWMVSMLTSLNAAENVCTNITISIKAEEAIIARIMVLFLNGLYLNRDFV